MKLFFDLRLGYLVQAPGQDTALTSLYGKAGDGDEVIIQFGRSSDPTGTAAIITAPTWTAENLSGGSVITVAIKEDGEYSDGTLLASNSTWTNDATAKTYTGSLSYNTTAINTALARADANAENDIASLLCGFELTFQSGGAGPWRSSVLPVELTLYHDIIEGSEGSPTDADDPDEYLLKASGIEWLPTITSKIGGTSVDFDDVVTAGVTVGKLFAFLDEDSTPVIRVYRLEAGTDAESVPDVIRPDDYNASTNAKVWKLYPMDQTSFSNPMTTQGDLIYGGASGTATRLAIGGTSQILGRVGSVPGWIDKPNPVPASYVTESSASYSLINSDLGSMILMDTSTGNVEIAIQEQATYSYTDNFHCWITCTSSSNVASLSWSGATDVNGRTSSLTVSFGSVLHIWREQNDKWHILSSS